MNNRNPLLEKINKLLIISELPVENFNKNYGKGLDIKMNQQQQLMDELKAMAKSQNTVVGRIMRFPCGDSYAYYVITNVQKFIVTLQWIRYCDEWIDDRLDLEGTLPLEYVYAKIKGEDTLEKLFPPRVLV